MPMAEKHDPPRAHAKDSSVFSVLSGWAQQGAQTLFATQRIVIDLAMRQNASVIHAVRQQLSDPHHSPTAVLSEVASEGVNNFIAGQKVLLELGKEQNELLMAGVKQQVADWPLAEGMADLIRRSVDTFINLQEEYLQAASKQTHNWLDATKAGKPYQSEPMLQLVRDNMESFVKAQKQFLDVIAEETSRATSGKHAKGAAKKVKAGELQELARQATDSLMEAQKRLLEVVGKQMNANVKTAGKTMELLRPFPLLPLNEITREAVKSYVEAQKALMDVMMRQSPMAKTKPERNVRRPAKRVKEPVAAA